MSQILAAALAAKFPNALPPWTDPFLKAARRMDILSKRDQDGTYVTAENKPKPPPAKKQKKGKAAKGKSKSAKKGKGKAGVSNDVVEDEENDGFGDDVEDEVIAAAAEELLIEATELSEGEEALPFTWLAIIRMQGEDWSRAREAALRAAELEPLDTNVLFRLSACYGQEKDFVNAHLYCERALALLSPQERVAHLEKFKRLQEQSKDVVENVYREDPFTFSPLRSY